MQSYERDRDVQVKFTKPGNQSSLQPQSMNHSPSLPEARELSDLYQDKNPSRLSSTENPLNNPFSMKKIASGPGPTHKATHSGGDSIGLGIHDIPKAQMISQITNLRVSDLAESSIPKRDQNRKQFNDEQHAAAVSKVRESMDQHPYRPTTADQQPINLSRTESNRDKPAGLPTSHHQQSFHEESSYKPRVPREPMEQSIRSKHPELSRMDYDATVVMDASKSNVTGHRNLPSQQVPHQSEIPTKQSRSEFMGIGKSAMRSSSAVK